MRWLEAERGNENGAASGGRLLALGLALGVLGFAGGIVAPAAAQRNWDPIVATAPGGALQGHQQLPVMVDPRQFPPPGQPSAAVPNDPLPQGAWSPLVTGAIPDRRPAQRRATATPKSGTDAVQSRASPVADGLSPIRPTRGGIVTGTVQSEPAASASDAADDASAPPSRPGPLDALPPNATAAQQYCFNTADTAADARFAWQAKKIQEMEAELNKRAEQLSAKTEEYKTWLARRDEFSRKAHEKLVGFYSRMRADAAAAQLAAIDEETAAAVVTKLETKVASQIMGEMEPAQAAKIASVIAGAARTKPAARRGAAARGAASGARNRDAAATPGNAASARGRPES
ncbi:hypothetical protein W911_04070 [Hyphomicrobium nitrativorans NL23]|uniref:Magnesium transporter MgtE intracellular domain-containing protein n=1 Tax=Hyphomicrobium nitrativorans NL23 TaxID=1029756 RepID=V5SAI6_9HYPH|nr:MotE family protein [Hyphomicrobium nitrativorans]AHB47771.1 hypothetical protein W911_04070 [Hyphomicrobium nitrativorans NL23]